MIARLEHQHGWYYQQIIGYHRCIGMFILQLQYWYHQISVQVELAIFSTGLQVALASFSTTVQVSSVLTHSPCCAVFLFVSLLSYTSRIPRSGLQFKRNSLPNKLICFLCWDYFPALCSCQATGRDSWKLNREICDLTDQLFVSLRAVPALQQHTQCCTRSHLYMSI